MDYPSQQHLGEAKKENGTYLNAVHHRFKELNNSQRGLLNEIESKLARIYAIKINAEPLSKENKEPVDFYQSMGGELDAMQYQTNRLEAILKHLHEII